MVFTGFAPTEQWPTLPKRYLFIRELRFKEYVDLNNPRVGWTIDYPENKGALWFRLIM